MDVPYCVVKKLDLSSEYFGRYCKKLLNQLSFIAETKDSLLKTEDVLLKTKDGLLKTEDAHKNKNNYKRVIGIAQLC